MLFRSRKYNGWLRYRFWRTYVEGIYLYCDYLLANGIPFDHIIAETHSFDTQEQVTKLAEIAATNHFHTIVVVSDGTHLFRIALLCRRAGLNVYTSPRASIGHIDDVDAAERVLHEMLSYTAIRLDLTGPLHAIDGKAD